MNNTIQKGNLQGHYQSWRQLCCITCQAAMYRMSLVKCRMLLALTQNKEDVSKACSSVITRKS